MEEEIIMPSEPPKEGVDGRMADCAAMIKVGLTTRDADIIIYALTKYNMGIRLFPNEQTESQDTPLDAQEEPQRTIQAL